MILTLLLAACGSGTIRSVTTTALPGQAVMTFPNSFDARWNTVLSSEPFTTQAGIDGRTLAVTLYHGAQRVQDDLTLDFDGNLGVRGVFKSVSSRQAKYDIRPYRTGALSLLRGLPLTTFHYRGEARSDIPHVGFIAEDAPVLLAGARHDSFNLNNSVGVTMAATDELDTRLAALSKRVAELERVVARLRNANARSSGSDNPR